MNTDKIGRAPTRSYLARPSYMMLLASHYPPSLDQIPEGMVNRFDLRARSFPLKSEIGRHLSPAGQNNTDIPSPIGKRRKSRIFRNWWAIISLSKQGGNWRLIGTLGCFGIPWSEKRACPASSEPIAAKWGKDHPGSIKHPARSFYQVYMLPVPCLPWHILPFMRWSRNVKSGRRNILNFHRRPHLALVHGVMMNWWRWGSNPIPKFPVRHLKV